MLVLECAQVRAKKETSREEIKETDWHRKQNTRPVSQVNLIRSELGGPANPFTISSLSLPWQLTN